MCATPKREPISGSSGCAMRQPSASQERKPEYYHRCTICGITDRTHPQMDFRYCSKCAGSPCYCADHLRNHEHIVVAPAAEK